MVLCCGRHQGAEATRGVDGQEAAAGEAAVSTDRLSKGLRLHILLSAAVSWPCRQLTSLGAPRSLSSVCLRSAATKSQNKDLVLRMHREQPRQMAVETSLSNSIIDAAHKVSKQILAARARIAGHRRRAARADVQRPPRLYSTAWYSSDLFPSSLTSPVPGRPVDVPTLPLALDYESQRQLDTDELRAGIERYNDQADQLREVSHSAAGSGADGRRLTAGTRND